MQPIYSPVPKFVQDHRRAERRKEIVREVVLILLGLVLVLGYFATVQKLFGPMPVN